MKLLYLALASLLLGCQGRTAVGLVTDGMTEQPVSGLRITARAQEPADMTCQVLEATTDETGKFLLEGTCAGILYSLESADKTIYLAGSPTLTGGQPPEEQLTLKAWRSPPGQGVYVLKGDEIFAMRVAAKVAKLPLWKSTDKVLYPETIPSKLPVITGSDFLILSGKKTIKRLELRPLIRHEGTLRFGSKNHYFDMDPWSYVGREFRTDSDHNEVVATIDSSKQIRVMEEKRALLYTPGSAVPPGVYALLGEGDKRLFLVEFKP